MTTSLRYPVRTRPLTILRVASPDEPPAKPAGGGEPPKGDAPPAPKYVTVEELNAAITGKLKSVTKNIEGFGEKFDALASQLEALAKARAPEPPSAPRAKGKGKADEEPPAEDPEKLEMKRQIEELQAQHKAREEADKAAKVRALQAEMRQSVVDGLRAAGVLEGFEGALALSMIEEGTVRRDRAGKVVFRRGDDGDLPLADGLREWAGGDGKRYLRPRDAAGSGAAKVGAGSGLNGRPAGQDSGDAAESALRTMFGGISVG